MSKTAGGMHSEKVVESVALAVHFRIAMHYAYLTAAQKDRKNTTTITTNYLNSQVTNEPAELQCSLGVHT
ncbi:unnamed protein product [Ceratitis capitata]|uniref:(Mediterranean fruit fly) hypothetical protein n=1 Tax=Ceratitis capitata TaxID=7213 RepID=A0A811VIF7_CERCA|nr:unnamed protein product [Ceratitis capitata]